MSKPYNYDFVSVENSAGYYTFTTKNETVYRVAFIPDDTLNSCVEKGTSLGDVFQIIVYIASGQDKYDSGTSKTIVSIIEDFFVHDQNSLLYVCDDSDKKAPKRFKHFDMWYNDSSMTSYVTKLDNIVPFIIESEEEEEENKEPEITSYHTSLLYHNNNTNIENIHFAYYNIKNVIEGDKPNTQVD